MVDLGDMNHGVAVGEGHHLVGLYNDSLGCAYSGFGIVAAHTERAVAFLVGRCGLEHGHIAGDVAPYHRGHVLEVGGEKVSLTPLNDFA